MPNPLATTAILIRHGERDEPSPTVPDPHLNAAGKARAQTLIHVVGKSGIKGIGHTDTIPELIKQFAGGSNFNIADPEFDKLFIVTVFDSSRAHVTELKYGNPN